MSRKEWICEGNNVASLLLIGWQCDGRSDDWVAAQPLAAVSAQVVMIKELLLPVYDDGEQFTKINELGCPPTPSPSDLALCTPSETLGWRTLIASFRALMRLDGFSVLTFRHFSSWKYISESRCAGWTEFPLDHTVLCVRHWKGSKKTFGLSTPFFFNIPYITYLSISFG